MGMSEGAIDEIVGEFFGKENPYLGIYSKADGIHLRIIARSRDAATAKTMIQPVEEAIHQRLGEFIWGYDDETPEQAIGPILKERGLTLATMESCTGGYLANSITERPDSAEYYKGGVMAYSDAIMASNGVPKETIENHGVVSQETATAMANAVRDSLNADYGIGIAGVLGPSEVEGKPVGLAYVAIVGSDSVKEFELRVPPRRVVIKRRLANQALIELRKLVVASGGAS